MHYRKLGHTGFDVSTIGCGTWQIGGKRWHGTSDEESIYMLQHACELGVNIYDVAVVYGQYKDAQGYLQSRAQELLGKAFAHKRDTVFYCLKLGQFDEYSHRALYHPRRLVEQFYQSLRRLQTDYVDICLVHAPSITTVKEERALAVLQTLQAQGIVRAIGYSFENEPEHVKAALHQDIDVIMLQYNLIDTQCGPVLKQVEENGIGVLVGGPYKRGYLTGTYRTIHDLPITDDYWLWNLKYNRGKVEHILERVNTLLHEHQNNPVLLRKVGIQTILQQRAVASLIVGHRALNEVKENITLCDQIHNNSYITPRELESLEEHSNGQLKRKKLPTLLTRITLGKILLK